MVDSKIAGKLISTLSAKRRLRFAAVWKQLVINVVSSETIGKIGLYVIKDFILVRRTTVQICDMHEARSAEPMVLSKTQFDGTSNVLF